MASRIKAAALALVITAGPVLAHEAPPDPAMPGHVWHYGTYCCSSDHCSPAPPGFVTRAPNGWMVGGVLISDGDKRIRPSGDTRFHPCRETDPELQTYHKWRCLYVPGASG